MCIAFIAWKHFEENPLVILANRDEYHARPTAPLGYWADVSHVLAGRDLQGGGTWLGVSTLGRVALLTNVREPGVYIADAPSRGKLVADFLENPISTKDFLAQLKKDGDNYNGFNIVFGDMEQLWWFSNRASKPIALGPGLHGVSNAPALNPGWPKVSNGLGMLGLSQHPEQETFFNILTNTERSPDHSLPKTGVGLEVERALSPIFIQAGRYGTRCSTVVCVSQSGQWSVTERSFGDDSKLQSEKNLQFRAS